MIKAEHSTGKDIYNWFRQVLGLFPTVTGDFQEGLLTGVPAYV